MKCFSFQILIHFFLTIMICLHGKDKYVFTYNIKRPGVISETFRKLFIKKENINK